MKRELHFLNFLFHLRGQIIIALLLFSAIAIAQESTPPEEFPIGASLDRFTRYLPEYYDSFRVTGMNYMHQHAGDSSKSLLEDFNFTAYNSEYRSDLIYYYSSAFYSKWEAEEDQNNRYKVGFKHRERVDDEEILGELIGSPATFSGRECWSSVGLTSPRDSLIYGPHYHQEKLYKRWYADSSFVRTDLKYTPRYKMALTNPYSVDSTQDVCRLYVVVRNVPDVVGGQKEDHVLKGPITLEVKDFQPYGTFKDFYLGSIDSAWYQYPSKYGTPLCDSKTEHALEQDTVWIDKYGDQGVEFFVDWSRNDTLCTLYIDNIEVYDNDGWNKYIDNPTQITQDIIEYANRFPQNQWPNMKYWGGSDEPSSLDTYTPIKTVDAILQSARAPRLLTVFNPYWEITVNNDTQLVRYYNSVLPEKLIIDPLPFTQWWDPARFEDWDVTRKMLQICSTLQPGFWYQAQASGYQLPNGNWDTWRQPSPAEFKAQTMLALAHGVKGILYWQFNSLSYGTFTVQGIIRVDFSHTPLWDVIHDNLVPRLKGTLGKKLLNLDYTGNYLQLQYSIPTQPQPVTYDYLTLGLGQPADNMNWHCGIFIDSTFLDDKYFLLTNLITTEEKIISVKIQTPNPGPMNYRFRNIEGLFDTTIQAPNYLIKQLSHPPGEGYLYEFAPVVKYGGKLIYNETISSPTTLHNEMIIKNGATLIVNATYDAWADIRIKEGGKINTSVNGLIQFHNGHKLIIEGTAYLNGLPTHKLKLDFLSPADENGIVIKAGGLLSISCCEVKNAVRGINWELNANYLNALNIDFIDCDSVSINILGREPGPTLYTSKIKYCNIENSINGICVANLPEIVIQQNSITNTDLGISLCDVTNAQIIDNQIHTSSEELEGIFASSTGGVIRGNTISGHTTGLHLANSSIDVGGNYITDCLYHAMYNGDGSDPYMSGRLIKDPLHIYPISGYNHFENNGGYEGELEDNDGSEIYFNNSNAIMRNGCNSIVDDREPGGELVNTLLLMNGKGNESQIEIRAEDNYWGETRISDERFGYLLVHYEPYYSDPCDYVPGNDMIITKTSTGEVIDTLYAIGEELYSLSDIEILYATAEKLFVTGDVEASENYYNQIINTDTTLSVKKEAYTRKYEIGKMLNRNTEYFQGLRETYLSLSESTSDSLLQKIFDQLSSLCLVAKEEYVPAIGEFDEIIQQNPNTEEAVYAEIDAITTALLVAETDSSLHKGRLGKYFVKSSGDYNSKLEGILRKHFGNKSKETEEELLPTEYTLYQNYPNPFNPTTTIKYDLPNTSDVSLIIYDILGRKVKELVNTKQQAGRYEIQFNASNLASGVYIYQLIADKYINAKKMILLK